MTIKVLKCESKPEANERKVLGKHIRSVRWLGLAEQKNPFRLKKKSKRGFSK